MKQHFKRAASHALARVGLQRLQKDNGTWARYSRDALLLAQFSDCNFQMLNQQQQHPQRINPVANERICNWFLPEFDNPFYGGIMTILRLANHLQVHHGIANRFIICGDCSTNRIHGLITKAFATLDKSSVISLNSADAIRDIPAADYSVATLWTTAYVLLGVQNTGLKFYMIQDFEPLFYPGGSTYAQAELTYHFGFYGIANTLSLKDIYERDYGGTAVALLPCVDPKVFWPPPTPPSGTPRRLFYYARPGVPRNGFELAAQALKLLKARLGDRVDIVCAGANWNPGDYGLDGIVRSVGLLPYEATGDLYRSCHAGLALMMTKHPSYLPFELMACGSVVVANTNAANTWLLKDKENCLLSPPAPSCLAETLEIALSDEAFIGEIRQQAVRQVRESHADWDRSLSKVSAFMLAQAATAGSSAAPI